MTERHLSVKAEIYIYTCIWMYMYIFLYYIYICTSIYVMLVGMHVYKYVLHIVSHLFISTSALKVHCPP